MAVVAKNDPDNVIDVDFQDTKPKRESVKLYIELDRKLAGEWFIEGRLPGIGYAMTALQLSDLSSSHDVLDIDVYKFAKAWSPIYLDSKGQEKVKELKPKDVQDAIDKLVKREKAEIVASAQLSLKLFY